MRTTYKGAVRLGFTALVLATMILVSAPNAAAITFQLTGDHCTGGCGVPPFGTVTVNQVGANVDIIVQLTVGYSFVKTGAADFQNFKFNGIGVSLADITVDPHAPALVAQTGAFSGDGTGDFVFGITCPSCGNGAAGAFVPGFTFHVANATIADVTAPNPDGILFVADVLAPNGNTGPVYVTGGPPTVPEPASLTLLGLGLFGAAAALRRKNAR